MHDNINYLYNVGWKHKEEKHNELKGRCPSHNHNDKTPSFSINKETGEFNCFSCEMQGKSLISLMMYVENISKEEAIKSLNPEPYKNIYKDIMDFCHYVITYKGERPPSIKHARSCVAEDLKKRNLHGSVVSKYKIGYSHNNLIKNLLKKYTPLEIENSGFVIDGKYFTSNRICIPFTHRGRLIGFSLRDTQGSERKYINIYQEHSNNWLAFLEHGESIVITEGVYDAITVKEYGYNACALMGTAINSERIKLLQGFKKIYLMLDNDNAGIKAMEKFLINSVNEIPNSQIFVCELPKYKDPDDCDKETIDSIIKNSKPCYKWIINTYLNNSNDYSSFINNLSKLKKSIETIKDNHYKKILSTMIDKEIENANEIFQPVSESHMQKILIEISKKFESMHNPLFQFKIEDGNHVLEVGNHSFVFKGNNIVKKYHNTKVFSMIHSPNSGWACNEIIEE